MGRRLLVIAGLACIGFGLWQLVLVAPSATRPLAAVLWLGGALVVHDGVLAPVAVLAGLVLRRILAPGLRRTVGAGVFVAVCLMVVALPALLTPGVYGNASATPRDYLRGLALALTVVLLTVTAGAALTRAAGAARRAGSRTAEPRD